MVDLKQSEAQAFQLDPLAQKELAARSFVYFLEKHVWILEPPQAGAPTGGRVKFLMWPHLVEGAEQLERPWKMAAEGRRAEIKPEDLHSVIGKSRQVGWSWLVAAFVAWLSVFHEGALSLMESEGQKQAAELMRKARYVYENMPAEWQFPLDAQSTEHLSFKGSDSEIHALPSTVKAGHGFTATIAVMDEADNHEYLAEGMAAIKPTTDAGGQVVLLSTVEKRKATSMFQAIFRQAQAGKGGYRKFFVPYTARPGRDEAWYERTKASIPPEELKGMTPDLYMEQNYPRDEEEMLAPPRAGAFFDTEMIDRYLMTLCREPMLSEGPMNIFVKPFVGHKYVAGTDTSEGVGRDYSVTAVLDLTTMQVVADIMSNELETDDLIYWSWKLLEMYHFPLWAIENLNNGRDAARKARDLKYRRLWRDHTKKIMGGADHLRDEPGWHTDGKNRFDIFNDLKEQVDKGALVVFNKSGLRQFLHVIKKIDKEGNYIKPEHRSGENDDYVIAVGLAYQMRKWAGSAMGGVDKMVARPPSF
ncbi:hypothetical protein LCGC14_0695270 [marine sediment metagenome]|uniref:Terminase large subunit gp17-like C-terminal domain-containing protein n=1 Tax=marine sediment metagenome TaxID=412755 RepID=A0A0F9T5H9_9ZZZZ